MREKSKAVLAEAVDEAKRYGLHPHATLVETVAGQAVELIVSHAQEIGADLIVMGTHGRRGLRRFALGSDAEQVARLAGIPVLLVRGETSDSPVTAKPRSSAPLATVDLD
ncbi:MAG: universal stress protein [Steroidobacteraceae bacterium]